MSIKYFKRLFYIFYYIRTTDFSQLKEFLEYCIRLTGKSRLIITYDLIHSLFKYNISPKDYFCFRFFERENEERDNWAGTGFMYEYQFKMNPPSAREMLENKLVFLKHFRSLVQRQFWSLDEIMEDPKLIRDLMESGSGRIVIKGSRGQIGSEVEVLKSNQFSAESLIKYMKKKNYHLLEEYVIQHSSLMALSPSGLNTVRIITQLYEGGIELIGARLRISVNSSVDNMAAGNLAAPVDIKTGRVTGPGVYSDITKGDKDVHPITGVEIKGFIIPHWDAVINLARAAALLSQENRSVGWDIAIKEEGPELIEGNHNWCKYLWQLPVKRGLRKELDKYL